MQDVNSTYFTWAAVEIVPGSTGYRLPTQAQWEYACRAGTKTAFNLPVPDGSELDWSSPNPIPDDIGWNGFNSGKITRQVGLKPPNTWGLYDTIGNVWEWCWDGRFNFDSYELTDPVGDIRPPTMRSQTISRAERGSGWQGNIMFSGMQSYENVFGSIRTPNNNATVGFRVIRP